MTIGVPIVTGVPRLYQKQSKTTKTQSKQHKNDHWCTSRHTSTKTVPTVCEQCTKNSQKTVKTKLLYQYRASVLTRDKKCHLTLTTPPQWDINRSVASTCHGPPSKFKMSISRSIDSKIRGGPNLKTVTLFTSPKSQLILRWLVHATDGYVPTVKCLA